MILRTSMSLLSLCFLFGCTSTGSSEGGLSSRIKSYQSQIIEDEITGSNLVIVGSADGTRAMSVVNSGRPGDRDVDASTIFPIWSMSKPITIVAMMTLHEQGKFEWNDPVADYISCFADLVVQDGDSVRSATEPLRIEHLMAHRSGWA
ncbi:MAG: serine hydrolase, partial [Planctomycetota bacterium]|nr:serine hydrolase [Planctomycetota bacterium]